jgi:hypothetical protein
MKQELSFILPPSAFILFSSFCLPIILLNCP